MPICAIGPQEAHAPRARNLKRSLPGQAKLSWIPSLVYSPVGPNPSFSRLAGLEGDRPVAPAGRRHKYLLWENRALVQPTGPAT
jgi:hypothetical protein